MAAFATVALAGVSPALADDSAYAPLDRTGPPLSVPTDKLRTALECTPGVGGATRNPILLVPGTNLTPGPNYSWNYERAFTGLGWPYCTITLPDHATNDIQVAGEYIVYALRTMAAVAHRKVDVLGFSQGGMVPRWALRFWPDTRALVGDLMGLDPSNHGTLDSVASCQAPCPPAHRQQAAGSNFIGALNSRAETFAGIDYTVAFSRFDEIVVPNSDASGSSALHTGSGRISNVLVQDICPNDTSDHLAMGSYDPVGYALTIDAFTHDGPASQSRISSSICSQPFQPGVNPATFPADYAGYLADIGANGATRTTTEPPLKCYVTAAGCSSSVTISAGSPCVARHRLSWRVHQHRKRVTRVRVYVDGKLKKSVRRRRVRRVAIDNPGRDVFTVRIVATTANGQHVISTRSYRGCAKRGPHTRIRRGHRHRRP